MRVFVTSVLSSHEVERTLRRPATKAVCGAARNARRMTVDADLKVAPEGGC